MKNILVAALLTTPLFFGNAQASPVTVDGTFLSFNTWLPDPAVGIPPSRMNGSLLNIDSSQSTPVSDLYGLNWYKGETTNFATSTTKLDFSIDSAGISYYSNSFEFIPNSTPTNVNKGDIFKLGTFRYTNGDWHPQTDITFSLTTHSSDTLLDGHSFTGTIRLTTNSVSTYDPEAQADYFSIVERPDLGSVRVYDKDFQPSNAPGWIGEVDFYAKIGSLIPTGFVAKNSATFLNPSVSASLTNPVPEPETYAMLLSGLGLIAMLRRTKRKSKITKL